MAAVLVVLYIPCDNENQDTNNQKENNGGNDDAGTAAETDDDAKPGSPNIAKSISGGSLSESGTVLPDKDTKIENGEVLLAQNKGSEHLPLLEHAAESPVVRFRDGHGMSTPTVQDEDRAGDGQAPRRRVRIAGEDNEEAQADETGEEKGGRGNELAATDSWSLEDALQELLGRLNVDNDVWTKTDDETVLQVCFLVPVEAVDAILRALTTFGLGSIPDTSITTFPASFHREAPPSKTAEETITDVENDGTITKSKNVPEEKSDFIKTIKARLTVAQVVAAVEGNARATFDFIMLICLASFIAALGLVENSSVILVASMLISPLMGPILGGVFGFVIQNRDLTSLGVKNASIGLLLCLVVGFLFGLAVAGVNSHGTLWGGSTMWPTEEMRSRGMTRSLWVGVLIALPSGAGVALSVLGGNVGSLVGVAISASLLPPAVNAGMLWAYSIISAIAPPKIVPLSTTPTPVMPLSVSVNGSVVNTTSATDFAPIVPESLVPPNCPILQDNSYQFLYSCTMANEAAILGAVSLFLTLLNIICIFIMGVIVLKIKEVAPHTSVSQVTDVFWKKDLPIARDCYKTLKGKDSLDAAKMAKDIAREWKKKHEDLDPKDMRKSWHYMIQDLEHTANIQDVAELQPTNAAPRRHTFMRNLSFQGHTVLEDKEGDEISGTPTPLSSSYHTTYSSDSNHLRHRNPFFANFEMRPTPSPAYLTPPTSNVERFNYPTVQRAQKPRVPRHMKRQQSLSTEIEKAVMKNLPERLGRFTVSTITEEPEVAARSPDKDQTSESAKAAPFLLKLPEKKSPTSKEPADSVVVEVESPPSIKELKDKFFMES